MNAKDIFRVFLGAPFSSPIDIGALFCTRWQICPIDSLKPIALRSNWDRSIRVPLIFRDPQTSSTYKRGNKFPLRQWVSCRNKSRQSGWQYCSSCCCPFTGFWEYEKAMCSTRSYLNTARKGQLTQVASSEQKATIALGTVCEQVVQCSVVRYQTSTALLSKTAAMIWNAEKEAKKELEKTSNQRNGLTDFVSNPFFSFPFPLQSKCPLGFRDEKKKSIQHSRDERCLNRKGYPSTDRETSLGGQPTQKQQPTKNRLQERETYPDENWMQFRLSKFLAWQWLEVGMPNRHSKLVWHYRTICGTPSRYSPLPLGSSADLIETKDLMRVCFFVCRSSCGVRAFFCSCTE